MRTERKTAIVYGLLLTLSIAPSCLAQSAAAPDSDQEASAEEQQQSKDMMKQSQMSVQELVKNGVIENIGDNSKEKDPYAPSQEDMDKNASDSRGGREFMSNYPASRPQYMPPTGMAPKKPPQPQQPAPGMSYPSAFSTPDAGLKPTWEPQGPEMQSMPNDEQLRRTGLPKPAVPAQKPVAPQEKPKSVTEGY